ncbi:MAG: CHAT domain-containing protein [Ignavibacteria bacterium]|nr:CHAT domain-containing protein [Ignavibacteria bacterium]
MRYRIIIIILFLIQAVFSYAQSWEELYNSTKSLLDSGKYESAKLISEKTLEGAKNEFGEESINYALSLSLYGEILKEVGLYKESEDMYNNSLEIFERSKGKNSEEYSKTLNLLSELYIFQNQYEKAEAILKEAISVQYLLTGEKNINYALMTDNLAYLYDMIGEFEKAESLYVKAINIYEKLSAQNSLNYSKVLSNLAGLYMYSGLYYKSEQLYLKALGLKKDLLGENHPEYSNTLNDIAFLYHTMGYYKKAEPLYKRVLELDKELIGENNLNYANTVNNLGLLYYDIGSYERAEPLFKQSLEIIKGIFSEKHPEYAKTLNNLAGFYYMTNNYEEAEKLYIKATEIYKELSGEKNIEYAKSLNNLAAVYYTTNNYRQAETLFIKASEIRKSLLGENHPEYAQSLNNIAFSKIASGNYKDAEKYLLQALKIRKESLGENHPDYAISLKNLALLYQQTGQYELSHKLYNEAKEKVTEVLGKNHPFYIILLNNMTSLLMNEGKYDEAGKLLKEANQNIQQQVYTYFPGLSETEKLNFLKRVNYQLDLFCSYVKERYNFDKSLIDDITNLRIIFKGITLTSNSRLKNIINKTNDSNLIRLYDEFITTRKEISKAYTLSIKEREEQNIDIRELENKSKEIEKEIGRKTTVLKSEEEKLYEWKQIRDNLNDEEAVIEYFDFQLFNKNWTDTIIYCASVIKKGIEHPIYLNLSSIYEIEEFLSFSQENTYSYIRNSETSNKLYNLLWKPIESHLAGIKRIYISPTGVLNKLSFAALIDSEGKYLVDRYSLEYINNLKDITVKKSVIEEEKITDNNAVIYGGLLYDIDIIKPEAEQIEIVSDEEDFKPEGKFIVALSEEKGYRRWEYLEGTKKEADNIKNLLQENNYEVIEYNSEFATEETFKNLNYPHSPLIIHIATHGFFFPEPKKKYDIESQLKESGKVFMYSDNPLFRSGLIFAGANRIWTGGKEIEGLENGILTAYEVANMDLSNTDLVILSACETGLGDIKGGEGVFGLQRAFKIAGVKTLIMSLWKVPDDATVELMMEFYKNWLVNKTDKVESFNLAQRKLRQKYSEPFFWAGFIIQ